MIRGLSQIALATTIRLASSICVFLYAATVWRPEEFGAFMYAFSVSAMLVLCCEFGFSQQVLRDVGRAPSEIGPVMTRFLASKIWLSAAVLAAGCTYALLSNALTGDMSLQFLSLLAAAVLLSFSDLVFNALRSLGRYGDELRVSTFSNGLTVVVLVLVIASGGTPLGLAVAILITRALQFVLVGRLFLAGWVSVHDLRSHGSWSNTRQTLRNGAAYASDVFVGAALLNLDMIIVSRMLGYVEAGVYQAAARLSQGVGVVFSVLASYFLPKLSAESVTTGGSSNASKTRFAWTSVVLGVVLILGFLVAYLAYQRSPAGTTLNMASALLPGFAALVIPRLLSGYLGVILTADGNQRLRAICYALALCMFVLLAYFFIGKLGTPGVLLAYAISYSTLAFAFMVILWRRLPKLPAICVAVSVFASSGILLFLI